MDAYDKGYGDSSDKDPTVKPSRSTWLGMMALFIGVVALALAALPMLIFERPTPSFRVAHDAVAEERESKFSFAWKNFKVSFGGSKQEDDEAARAERESQQLAATAAQAADAQALVQHETRLRWLMLASAGLALFGLMIGPIAWVRERHPALAGFAMAISGVALFWQYIVIGVVVGIIVVIVLAYLGSLAT